MSTDTMRAAFEAWASDQGHVLDHLEMGGEHAYADLRTEGAWWAWQAALAAPAPQPLPEHADHVAMIATRLRRLARAVGRPNAVPPDDETAVGAIFTVLGSLAGHVERSTTALQPAAWVDPATLARVTPGGITPATLVGRPVDRFTQPIFTAPSVQHLKPFTPVQRQRLYDNSPEHHKDATSRAGFERIVTLVERAHSITAIQEGQQ